MSVLSEIRMFLNRLHITVEPVVFLYFMAIFLEMSVTQDLLTTKICLKITNATTIQDCSTLTNTTSKLVRSDTLKWLGYYGACMFACTLVIAVFMGSWSDYFSRKYTMLMPPLGSMLATAILALMGGYVDWHEGWMLIPAAVSGITGGTTAIVGSAFGYVADVSSSTHRTKRISILEAMIFIGGTTGMYISGAFLKFLKHSYLSISPYAAIFIFELCLHVVVALYVTFFVVDLKPNTSISLSQGDLANCGILRRLFNVKHIYQSLQTVVRPRRNQNRMYVWLLLLISLLVYYGLSVQIALLFVFVRDEPLFWDQTKYSFFSAINFGVCGITLLVGLPVAYRFFSFKDTTVGILGLVSRMSGLILLGLSNKSNMVFLCVLPFLFSEYCAPSIRAILSKIVEPDEKGKIFTIMACLQSLCLFTGSQIFTNLYDATATFFKGFCFELVAGFQAIALVLMVYLHFTMNIANEDYTSMPKIGEMDDDKVDEEDA